MTCRALQLAAAPLHGVPSFLTVGSVVSQTFEKQVFGYVRRLEDL